MIGLRLHMIDERLRAIRPQFRDKPFRRISVVLFGDSLSCHQWQIYDCTNRRLKGLLQITQHAMRVYRESFPKAFQLTQQMRQREQGGLAEMFQEALTHLRDGGNKKCVLFL
jgi:hypothetical protein